MITPDTKLPALTEAVEMAAHISGPAPSQPLHPIYGTSHTLYGLLPRAISLFVNRLAEQAAGKMEPTSTFMADYTELSLAIECWSMPSFPHLSKKDMRMADDEYLTSWKENCVAGECMQHALRIYIITAHLGSQPPTAADDTVIQREVDMFFDKVRKIMHSLAASNLMWPIIIVGSCLRDQDIRDDLINAIKFSDYKIRPLSNILEALQILWADPDPTAFGPYGLQRVLDKNNISICFAN